VFERFTDDCRRVVVLAQEEARLLAHDRIGSEHLLLAILREGGVVASALAPFGLTVDRVRAEVERRTPPTGSTGGGHIPFTPHAKKAMEKSLRESLKLGDTFIGTAHLMLGLLEVEDSLGLQIVSDVSDDLDEIKAWLKENRGLRTESETSTATASPFPEEQVTTQVLSGRRLPGRGMIAAMAFGSGHQCSFCSRDLWEVEASVAGRAAAICVECVQAAADALHAAAENGAPTHEPLQLPPRVFGPKPMDADAVAGVSAALRATCGGHPRPLEEMEAAMEDGAQLAPLILDAGQRFPGTGLSILGMRFIDDDHAQVRFEIVIGAGGGGMPFQGDVVRRDGRWLVTRGTVLTLLGRAGIHPPPPPEG
jgi:hypothetical protein